MGQIHAERNRMHEDAQRTRYWSRWGPYLAERQWGTVREDYSERGEPWSDFPHDHARSRAYRWGEDGLLGLCDAKARLCFALALWNERDPILKERLFGLTGPEGNHGEDVKECYWYLDATPTASYLKALYKYPQLEYPYEQLLRENARRGRHEPEYELLDTGVFDEERYFDVSVEYAKASPNDILIRITVQNHARGAAPLHVLPTLWFRNTWAWAADEPRPHLSAVASSRVLARHEELGSMLLCVDSGAPPDEVLFTDNDTNTLRLYGVPARSAHVKDAFHACVVSGDPSAVNPEQRGTKCAPHFKLALQAGGRCVLRLRLVAEDEAPREGVGTDFDRVFDQRIQEAHAFYETVLPAGLTVEERLVARQAYAGLVWSKQFYHYVVRDWLDGDPAQPRPPAARLNGRNRDWTHLYNRDVLSVPDKWEYPWYAAWDLAFHMIPFARLDPGFAKQQLLLLLREWYMHPNGQIPAYEFDFSDVNPPVHAWAAWRVYKLTARRGERDRNFLAQVFHKLLLNFTWWVNRKDHDGNHIFSGGFLGLDNIGVFDRSRVLPARGHLDQSDATAWMAFYCGTMLSMALELAREDDSYEGVASKFFEHFVAIVDAMNSVGGTGLWDEEDGFYYDRLHVLDGRDPYDGSRSRDGSQSRDGSHLHYGSQPHEHPGAVSVHEGAGLRERSGGGERSGTHDGPEGFDDSRDDARVVPLRVRSMVGIIPLFAVEVLEQDVIARLPGFRKRMEWFLGHRSDLARHVSYCEESDTRGHRLLAIPSRERLLRVLERVFDEQEFLSPFGVRSLSRHHDEHPYTFRVDGQEHTVRYAPGESDSGMFGGNSNWRGPVWLPLNYLFLESLERYHHFYGDSLQVEFPTGSGRRVNLLEASREIRRRLCALFLPDAGGGVPCNGPSERFREDPHWRELVAFHEYFHADTGCGLGASHQTGWTALVVRLLERQAAGRRYPKPHTSSDSTSRLHG